MILVRKSQRSKTKLRLGITAPSGCGKTMGALFFAYGITGNWDRVGFLDTEEGSGELYSGLNKAGVQIGEYNYSRVSAPYTIPKYIDTLRALEACSDIVIMDSISHAWRGSGGILEKQGKVAASTKNSYTAWGVVTPEQEAFVDSMLHSPRHIIATMRSKTEYILEANAQGKMVPRKIGLAPIQREGMEYEFTTVFDINFDGIAEATKDRTSLFSNLDGAGRLEKRSFRITPETGKEILQWLETGVESIESLAERMSQEIKATDDVPGLYASYAGNFARLDAERPGWKEMMFQLFERRSAELKNKG